MPEARLQVPAASKQSEGSLREGLHKEEVPKKLTLVDFSLLPQTRCSHCDCMIVLIAPLYCAQQCSLLVGGHECTHIYVAHLVCVRMSRHFDHQLVGWSRQRPGSLSRTHIMDIQFVQVPSRIDDIFYVLPDTHSF